MVDPARPVRASTTGRSGSRSRTANADSPAACRRSMTRSAALPSGTGSPGSNGLEGYHHRARNPSPGWQPAPPWCIQVRTKPTSRCGSPRTAADSTSTSAIPPVGPQGRRGRRRRRCSRRSTDGEVRAVVGGVFQGATSGLGIGVPALATLGRMNPGWPRIEGVQDERLSRLDPGPLPRLLGFCLHGLIVLGEELGEAASRVGLRTLRVPGKPGGPPVGSAVGLRRPTPSAFPGCGSS